MAISLEQIERTHVVLLALAVGAAYLSRWLSPWSVLLGGAVMGVNFWLMRQLFARLMRPENQNRPGIVLGLALVKFSLFVGLLAVLFWRVQLDALAFGVGATVLLVACVAAALRQQPPSLDPSPASGGGRAWGR